MKRDTIVIVILVAIAFVLGLFVEHKLNARREPGVIVTRDTIYVSRVDTFIKPVPVYRRVIDSIIVPCVDTTFAHDTTFAVLPRESIVYEDSLYRAVVSGYKPSLDTISVNARERVVNTYIETVKTSRWSVGLQAGYGASKEGLSPYIGIGVQYNIFSW